MSMIYEFSIPYTGTDTDVKVSDWFRNIGWDHWMADYRLTPPDNWPKQLGANPPRRMYKREMIVGIMDDEDMTIALQFKLAFQATMLTDPFFKLSQ
jgi:hypothetical protein